MTRAVAFDAVVLAAGPVADRRVCGLSLGERGRRVAARAGALRVLVVDGPETARTVSAWASAGEGRDLLVLRASDQVVHFPLVDAVRPDGDGPAEARVAVAPEGGAYAGALWVPAARSAEVAAALAGDPDGGDAAIARAWLADGRATARPHGDLARHPAVTAEDRRGATRMLFRLVHKKQDGPVTRWLYRPVAYPLTRLLLPTPFTPNQVSLAVGVIGVIGCLLTARPGYWDAVLGSLLVLVAGYLDCCDGEIARLRHEGSKLGAWLDTVTDEMTTLLYLAALGWHVYQAHPLPWVGWSIPVAVLATALSIFVIYYYLAVVAHSGNSQDYPTSGVGPLAPLTQLMRRDFMNWVALVLALASLTEVMYALLAGGALVSAIILVPEHLALRRRLRAEARAAAAGGAGAGAAAR